MPAVSVSRSTALVGASVLVVLLVLAGQRLAGAGAASGGAGRSADATEVAPLEAISTPAAAASRVVVHVVGAVNRPGLYRLREGSRVADAVSRAGGATRRANLAALNLAAPLVDGVQVLVPARVEAAGGSVPGGDALAAGAGGVGAGAVGAGTTQAGVMGTLSLATATAEQLDELPGVGPVTAQKILDYRAEHGPFRSVDDLDAVPGIGPTRIEQLRDLVTP
jgi:competence protein ComEA